MNRYLALALVISLAVNAVFIYMYSFQRQNVERSIDSNLVGVVYPVLELTIADSSNNTVYRYTKVGDPPTKNFMLWILHSFWSTATNKELIYPAWTAEDGSTSTPPINYIHGASETTVSGVSSIAVKIALGTSTTPPSIDDYRLGNKVVEFGATRYMFGSNSTHMWIYIRGVYTATSTITFQEVGMFGYFYITYKWFMLFRDVLPQPITLNAGDSIIVGYYIYIRYA